MPWLRSPSVSHCGESRATIAHRLGQCEAAEEWIGKISEANAKAAMYHSNLGNALQAQGRLEDAVAQYQAGAGGRSEVMLWPATTWGARCRRNANGRRRPSAMSGRLRFIRERVEAAHQSRYCVARAGQDRGRGRHAVSVRSGAAAGGCSGLLSAGLCPRRRRGDFDGSAGAVQARDCVAAGV